MAEKKEEKLKEKPEAKPVEKPEAKPKDKAERVVKAKARAEKEREEEEFHLAAVTLIDADKYLKTGAHIGTKFKSGEMKRFIYKERKDGLKVLNVQTLDERIKLAANFLSQFELNRLVVVSRKLYGQTPVEKFAEAVGCKVSTGRFVPGTFTNPQAEQFLEPEAVIVTESDSDSQAILEASSIKAPVVALVSTNNTLKDVDFAIPVNNKGRKSIALVYWLLARELLKAKGEIKSDKDFKPDLEGFEFILKGPVPEMKPRHRFERRGGGRRRGRR